MDHAHTRRRWEKIKGAARGGLAVLFVCAAGAAAQVPAIGPSGEIPVSYDPQSRSAAGLDALEGRLAQSHPEIPPAAVAKAFGFLRRNPVSNRNYVAIADFDRPSDEPRLSIINMADGSVESFLVAHGSGSGGRYATQFSDDGGSHQSSLGVYLTGEEYQGGHGRSLKLRGMEASNASAEPRGVVLHSAAYVSPEAARSPGMIGRSWGCPAVSEADRDRIIDELHDGAVLLIYHSGQ